MTVEIDEIEIAVPAVVPQIVEAREEAAIRVRTRARVVSGWRCSDRTRAIFEACTVGGRSGSRAGVWRLAWFRADHPSSGTGQGEKSREKV